MEIDFILLYRNRPSIEMFDTDVEYIDDIQNQLHQFINELYSKNVSGGNVEPIFYVIGKSLLEIYTRNEAISESGKCPLITNLNYEKGFLKVNNLLTAFYSDSEQFKEEWCSPIISYIITLLNKNNILYENYLKGNLCERYFLDNEGVNYLVNELITNNIVIRKINKKTKLNTIMLPN